MILVEQNIEPDKLLEFFKKSYSEKDWFYANLFSNTGNEYSIKANSMGFYVTKEYSESYPMAIYLMEIDEAILSEYQGYIAKDVSEKYQTKTVIDFTHPEKPDNPYYSLLFDKGDCFLVDDIRWEEKEEFVVIEPWHITQ